MRGRRDHYRMFDRQDEATAPCLGSSGRIPWRSKRGYRANCAFVYNMRSRHSLGKNRWLRSGHVTKHDGTELKNQLLTYLVSHLFVHFMRIS